MFDLEQITERGEPLCVYFNPRSRWHGWLFRTLADGRFVSVRPLKTAPLGQQPLTGRSSLTVQGHVTPD